MNIAIKRRNTWKIALPITLVVLALIGTIFAIYRNSGTDDAHALSNFNPGNIITNAKMGDVNAMNESQIRSFINQRNANCSANNSLCFRNYREGGKDAARLIFEASREQRINPQVILATVQKEQGLVTHTNPQQWMYNSAMGYACPDSTPGRCGAEQRGFLRQLVWGSTMYRAILDGGNSWSNRYSSGTRWFTPYNLGNNNIQWHPNASCGSSTVNIQNRATQALYNYTPYRPNQAALNAGYGTGNSCSAYGNRNFYLYMRDWFNYTTAANSYTWSSQSQQIYYDEARTQQLPYNAVLHPGQTVYVEVKARNTGNVTWQRDNTRFATPDRTSAFRNSSWPTTNRAARLVEQSVAPGATGTFRFSVTAPNSTRTYNEYFNVVLEGQSWLRDIGFFMPIRVVDTREIQLFSNSARNNRISNNQVDTGSTVYGRLRVTNNTATTIPANTRIGTTNPENRSSALRHDSWISNGRVAQLGRELKPGESANVDFTLQSQNHDTTIDEYFGLVIDGVRWLEQGTIRINYTVRERPQDRIVTGGTILRGEELRSTNGTYRLVLQGDGNLVLYNAGRAIWNSRTVGSGANRLVVQGDGNLVLYAPGRAAWSSGTVGSGANRLVVQGDGNLVLYAPGRAAWSSGTVGR